MKINSLPTNKLDWDVCLFFAFYVVAPDYCAIELSSKLPLLTLSRMLLVLMGALLVVRRRDLFSLKSLDVKSLNFGLSTNIWLQRGLLLYFATLMVCDLILLPSNPGTAIKALAELFAESYVLVWLLSLILNTRKKIVTALKILVFSSGVSAVIAMIGCVLEYNPFHLLNFVQREMMMNMELRLGVIRAAAGFGHPCFYGAFCAIISPVNMYFVECCEKKWERKLFAVCLALNIAGIVLSNSRGSFLTFGCVVLIAGIWNLQHRTFKNFLRTYLPVGLLALLFLVIVSLLSPVGLAFLLGIVKSILNIFFPDISMSIVVNKPVVAETAAIAETIAGTAAETAAIVQTVTDATAEAVTETSTVISYGINESGIKSRLEQLSGIEWTMMHKPLFGFGHNAHLLNLIFYQLKGDEWWPTGTFDVGVVAIICQYGIVGLLGYIALFGALLRESLSKACFRDPLMQFLCFAVVIYLVHLLTIASLDKMLWILISAIVCLSNVIRNSEV